MSSEESATHPHSHSDQLPLAVLKSKARPRLYSLEQYLRREERSMEKHEYYNGQIVRLPMAKGPHNIITANLISAVKVATKTLDKKYIAFSSSQLVYLPSLNFSLYPDALVVCEAPQYWDNNEVLLINPILIIEVLSKSTRAYDRGNKFREYKTLPSFMEYVLIEQTHFHAETFFREETDLWRNTIITDRTAALSLQSLGCAIQMADIYENIDFSPKPSLKR